MDPMNSDSTSFLDSGDFFGGDPLDIKFSGSDSEKEYRRQSQQRKEGQPMNSSAFLGF